jgi:hypothetical protein
MIIAICIVMSLAIGFVIGYSYMLNKICAGCRSIPSSHNTDMVKCPECKGIYAPIIECCKCGHAFNVSKALHHS